MLTALLLAAAVAAAPVPPARARLAEAIRRDDDAPASRVLDRLVGWWAVVSDPCVLRFAPVAALVAVPMVGLLPAVAVALVLASVSEIAVSGRRRARDRARLGHWERALESVEADLRSGQTATEALAGGAHTLGSTGGEVGEALAAAHGVAVLGGDAAGELARGGDPTGVELSAMWRLSRRHGIPLAAVVERLRADVSDRRDRTARVEASLAGPRATSLVLSALPLVGLLMGTGIGADPVGFLTGSLAGGVVCVAGSAFLSAGLWWSARIVDGASR